MKKIISFILAIILISPCFSGISISAAGATCTIDGATLNLGSTLTIDYYASLSEGALGAQMKFTSSSGRITMVDGVYDSSTESYKYSYTGINPQCMGDTIKAELILGETVLAVKEEYSVMDYCGNQMRKSASSLGLTKMQYNAFKTLLADLLVYGGEAQRYRKYNIYNYTDDMELVNDLKSTFAPPIGVKTVEGNKDASNKVKSLGLNMANVNKIYFKLILTDDVTITLNEKNVDKAKLTKNSDGTYMLYTDGINANGFDDVYTLKLISGGEEISSVSYNVNAYIRSKYRDETIGAIVKALYNYGASAENYVKAMNNVDADFDIDDEDIFVSESENIIDETNSNFDNVTDVSQISWTAWNGVTLEISDDGFEGNCLKFTKPNTLESHTYQSAIFDISPYITAEGYYEISFKVKLAGATEEADADTFGAVIRTSAETSFASSDGTSYYKGLGQVSGCKNDAWYKYSAALFVEESDIGVGAPWRLCLHNMQYQIPEVYIDELVIIKKDFFDYAESVTSAETWVANELVLVSDTLYDDPYNAVDVDLILTDGETTLTVPGFWDGDRIWRVRFACPNAGTWTYTTVCSDTENVGLHNITNTFECTEYSGNLDIYKHGFVTTNYNKKYFTYADGTPFFYLGDTHWSLGGETMAMVREIVDKRVAQGYTVYQSEPLGVSFNLANGVSTADIAGLRKFDEKFQYIASKGLVHANAEFFFSSTMETFIQDNGGYSTTAVVGTLTHQTGEKNIYDLSEDAKAALERLSRYWVARYSAYPVMWTMAQEVDNDYFWQNANFNGHECWAYVNNPYRYIATCVGKHDPYNSPLSAHMEHSGFGANNSVADSGDPMTTSAFNDIEAHNWFAAQWKSLYDGNSTESIAKIAENFWNSDKIAVNYEGKYWYLATKDFGARAQGWGAFLSGMYGHGWGGQDTWCYKSTYSENGTDYYGTKSSYIDIITAEEKIEKTWKDALYSDSSAQMVILKDFFEETVGDWWNLIPRFEDTDYLARSANAYAVIASNSDNSEIVAYFYNFTDASIAENANSTAGTATGTFGNLIASATYNYKWFDPITSEFTSEGTFTADSNGKWAAGEKATSDMVLYIYK